MTRASQPIAKPPAKRTVGPLSTTRVCNITPSRTRKELLRQGRKHSLSGPQLAAELAEVKRVVDLSFVPRTPAQRQGITIRDRIINGLKRKASNNVTSTLGAIRRIGSRTAFCALGPGISRQCDPNFKAPPLLGGTHAAYELARLPGKIAQLKVRSLSRHTPPSWAGFLKAIPRLNAARAILLDMRSAAGTDPRPLLAWVRDLVGRPQLKPLRKIRRPPALATFVDRYRSRHLAGGRDTKLWATLVASGKAVLPKPLAKRRQPIAVLVGRHCQAACELITRILVTYADATVLGGVAPSGRLHRDEPALLTLPYSRIAIYFHATEYLLSKAIEASTGPTGDWWFRRRGEPMDNDGTALALRELTQRLKHPKAWTKRCSALRSYPSVKAFPPRVRRKFTGAAFLDKRHCNPAARVIKIEAEASLHTLRRFIATCPSQVPVVRRSDGVFGFSAVVGAKLLSRVAQHPMVRRVRLRCALRRQPY